MKDVFSRVLRRHILFGDDGRSTEFTTRWDPPDHRIAGDEPEERVLVDATGSFGMVVLSDARCCVIPREGTLQCGRWRELKEVRAPKKEVSFNPGGHASMKLTPRLEMLFQDQRLVLETHEESVGLLYALHGIGQWVIRVLSSGRPAHEFGIR